MRRTTRLDRVLGHLDRVLGPPDAIVERLEEIDELMGRFTRYLPKPPLPPLPGLDRTDAEKECVLAFYGVLREKYGEEEARRIVEEAAKRYQRRRT